MFHSSIGCHRGQANPHAVSSASRRRGLSDLERAHVYTRHELLVVITLRLIQRLSLLYGIQVHDPDQRLKCGGGGRSNRGRLRKDLAEKQILEATAPRSRKP